MPPKPGKKRGRESTAGTTSGSSPATADDLPSNNAAAPGSAPAASRRTRSNSATSQQDDDGDGSRATKRSRRGGPGGTDSNDDDVDMDDGEEEGPEGPPVANGGQAAAAAAAAGATKKGNRRKSASAAVENGEPSAAGQPAAKRGRKSTSSVASAAPAAPGAGAPPIANGRQVPVATAGAAGGGRPPLPASRTPAAGAALAGGWGAGGRGSAAAVSTAGAGGTPSGGDSGRAAAASASRSNGGGGGRVAGPATIAAVAAEQARLQTQAAARAEAAVQARARAQQRQRQPQASPAAAGPTASSPVPAARLRRVTGPGAGNGDDDSNGSDGGGGGGGGTGEGSGAGAEAGIVRRRWQSAVARGKGAWAVVSRKAMPNGGGPSVRLLAGSREVLPVVQRATLKCLMFLVFLLGARMIWTATLRVAGGLVRGGGDVSGGGGGGGRVSRRQAALSVVRQSEGFRSLEGVLFERRRYLKEIEAQDEQEQETLRKLRGFVRRMDSQMQLLREQAEAGVASRGAPEDPAASESVSLSQLDELKTMREEVIVLAGSTSNAVEEGEQWTTGAAQELEALVSRSPSSHQHMSTEETQESELDADETWKADFEGPLEEAFLDLEGVLGTVNSIMDVAAAKPGVMEGGAYVRLVEDAGLSAAADADAAAAADGDRNLQTRVEAIAAQEVALKWGEAEATGEHGGGDAVSKEAGVLATVEEAEELVAREVEMFSSGGTGMPDYASLTPGAKVVHGPFPMAPAYIGEEQESDGMVEKRGWLTSKTLASTELEWHDYLLHMLRVPGRVYAEDGDAALSASNSLGSCFAFKGGEGRLTVELARPLPPPPGDENPAAAAAAAGFVRVTHVSIEHARAASAPTAAQSAPRAFRVLGWDADPASAATITASLVGGGGDGGGEALLRPHVLLAGGEYQVGEGAPGVQTFAVGEGKGEEAAAAVPPVGWVTLEVQSNHGGAWTCLYGFRVHGDPIR